MNCLTCTLSFPQPARRFFCNTLLVTALIFFAGNFAGASNDFPVYYLEDSAHAFSPEKLINDSSLRKRFIQSKDNSPNIGFTNSVMWVLIDLPKLSKQDRILIIENAHLDSVTFYAIKSNTVYDSIVSGDHTNFYTRYHEFNYVNFLIEKGTEYVLLKISSQGASIAPVKIFPDQKFYSKYSAGIIIFWTYIGILVLTFLTNLVLFIWLRESIYAYYALCVISLGFVNALDLGYTFQYLWPEYPVMNNYNAVLYSLSAVSVIFTDRILNLKKTFPFIHRFLQVLILVFIVLALIGLLGYYSFTIQGMYILAFIIPVICTATGTIVYQRLRNSSSRLFLIAWTGYFLSVILYALTTSGHLPYNLFTSNLMLIGSSVEILFLFLAVMDKINELNKEKGRILSEQNKMLEAKVKERTEELEKKNDEVLSQKQVIEYQNSLLKDDQVRMAKMVEEKTHELTDKNERLEQFAYIAAHNLRGPVATLLGLSQVLNMKTTTDSDLRDIMEKSVDTVWRLDSIIRDLTLLLDVQSSEGKIFEEINLSKALADVTDLLQEEINESGMKLIRKFDNEYSFSGISVYINSSLYNLIGNAIKFRHPKRPLVVEITAKENKEHITIEVKDNGLGIDLTKFGTKIFTPFKRFHEGIAGRGLGLHIVKCQVEAMKGVITVISEPEGGTTFVICLRKS